MKQNPPPLEYSISTPCSTDHGDPAEGGDGLADRRQVVEEDGASVPLAEVLRARDLIRRRLEKLHQHVLRMRKPINASIKRSITISINRSINVSKTLEKGQNKNATHKKRVVT